MDIAGLTILSNAISSQATLSGIAIALQCAIFNETQTANTQGGTFTSGAQQTRTLNTIAFNNISGVTLVANAMTLPAGSYICLGLVPANQVGHHQARLFNNTDSSTILVGGSGSNSAGAGNNIPSIIIGSFTLSASKALIIQHQCQSTEATDGFGIASNVGNSEVYTQILFVKVG